jgi:2-polyprenyl-6-methoxyphenol hydroxylase-like FAD-dependent oxidoreductase
MAQSYDVITVGGGLGGAALGKSLAEKGVRVLMLEREAAFRDKVRGEYVHPWGVTGNARLDSTILFKQTCARRYSAASTRLPGHP